MADNVVECPECAAAVFDAEVHKRWHDELLRTVRDEAHREIVADTVLQETLGNMGMKK